MEKIKVKRSEVINEATLKAFDSLMSIETDNKKLIEDCVNLSKTFDNIITDANKFKGNLIKEYNGKVQNGQIFFPDKKQEAIFIGKETEYFEDEIEWDKVTLDIDTITPKIHKFLSNLVNFI